MQNYIILLGLALAQLGESHMFLLDPPALRIKENKNTPEAKIDYTPTAPINAAQFPCKNALDDLDTPGGASVATWAPGSSQTFTPGGSAAHNGGSCQASLSYDKGGKFTVIQSIQGGCPVAGQKIPFTVPADAPTGPAVFAWTWVNKSGNREFYMSCASVTIGGPKAKMVKKTKRADVAFSSRPTIFVANLNNGCTVKDETNAIFPDAGPNVSGITGDSASTIEGTCQAVKGNGGSTGSGSPAAPAAPASPASPAAPTNPATPNQGTPTLPGGVFATVAPAPAPSGTGNGSGEVSGVPVVSPTAVPAAPGGSSPSSDAPAPSLPTGGPSAPPPSPQEPSTPAPPASPPATGGAGSQSGACTTEGQYNCIGGTAFQRCASGTWSVSMAVAAGTKCTPGISDTLAIGFAKRESRWRSMRFARAGLE